MAKGRDVEVCVRVIKNHFYHWHEEMTIVMVVAGDIKLRVRAQDNIMRSGDVVVLNRGEVHSVMAITEENLVVIISFRRSFCIEYCSDFEETIILCNSAEYMESNKSTYHELQLQLKDLIYEYGKEPYSAITKERAKQVVQYLCFHFDFISSGKTHKRFSAPIIKRNKMLYRTIFLGNSDLAELSLKDLAKHLGVSYAYFRIYIFERFGCGYSWLKYIPRTDKAARSILGTEDRMIDISNQCGFSDPKYFRKYIKTFYQCNPSELREQYKEQCTKEAYMEIPLKYIVKFCETFKKLI